MVLRLRQQMPAPAVAVAPFGLINSRTLVEGSDEDEHWAGGFETLSERGTSGLYLRDSQLGCDAASTQQIELATAFRPDDRSHPYNPFIVTAQDKSPAYGCTWEERTNRALRQLKANLSYAAEVEFWYGDLARLQAANGDTLNRYLTTDQKLTPIEPGEVRPWGDNILVDVTPASAAGGVADYEAALGILEDAANTVYHDAAFIHLPRFMAPALKTALELPDVTDQNNVIITDPIPEPGKPSPPNSDDPVYIPGPIQQSDIIRTANGNFVISGHGYSRNYYSGYSSSAPNMGPWDGAQHKAGVWMYATGPVAVRVGDPVVIPASQSMAYTSNNQFILSAEVPVSVVWDGPYVFAIRVKEIQ